MKEDIIGHLVQTPIPCLFPGGKDLIIIQLSIVESRRSKRFLSTPLLGIPCGLVVRTQSFHCQRAWVQPPVGELGSHELRGVAKDKKQKRRLHSVTLLFCDNDMKKKNQHGKVKGGQTLKVRRTWP